MIALFPCSSPFQNTQKQGKMAAARQTARKISKAARKSGGRAGTAKHHGRRGAPTTATKRRSYRPGTKTLFAIRRFQATTHMLCARASFQRVVRECAMAAKNGLRFQHMALTCLQDATENYIVGLLSDANLLCLHAKRVTVFPRDLNLARRLRGERH